MKKFWNMTKKKAAGRLILFAALFTALAASCTAAAGKSGKPSQISAVGSKTVSAAVGKEIELKVRTTPGDADDDYLKWEIVSGSSYVRFEDHDVYDDEIDLITLKAGTAKVSCSIRGTQKKVTFTVKVTGASEKTAKKIARIGSKTKTVEAEDDFELKVKKYAGLKDRNLKWTIKNTSIVKFDDHETTGDEVEFEARQPGVTTITCTNTKTKQKLTYTVKVVPEQEDDDEDDD